MSTVSRNCAVLSSIGTGTRRTRRARTRDRLSSSPSARPTARRAAPPLQPCAAGGMRNLPATPPCRCAAAGSAPPPSSPPGVHRRADAEAGEMMLGQPNRVEASAVHDPRTARSRAGISTQAVSSDPPNRRTAGRRLSPPTPPSLRSMVPDPALSAPIASGIDGVAALTTWWSACVRFCSAAATTRMDKADEPSSAGSDHDERDAAGPQE